MTAYVPVGWAAVHKFELEFTSNLKISTLNLKLQVGSSDCNKYMRWIKAVAVQLNNSPH
jgi:hypothetical protein